MNPYVLILTEPFVALPIILGLSCFLTFWYAALAPERLRKYSRFLVIFQQADIPSILLIGGVLNLIILLFTYTGHIDTVTSQQHPTISEGIYLYGVAFIGLLFFFTKASFLEKRDIVGIHKQKTKRLEQLIIQHLVELQAFHFEGKTGMKTAQILSQMKGLQIETAQEKKVRKNKENIYRSIDRLGKIELARKSISAQIEQLQKEITAMYDTLYALEATALEARYENLKKQLNIVKEKIKYDPFEAQIYLKKIQENHRKAV